MPAICFTPEDLDLFRLASHDSNPLHTSRDYARRTAYGDRVVYGVLNAIMALGHTAVLDRPGWSLSKIECDFFDAASLGVEYSIAKSEDSPSEITVRVSDGRRPVLEIVLTFRPGPQLSFKQSPGKISVQSEARNLNLSDFQVGERVSGTYAAGQRELESLCARAALSPCWAAAPQVPALLWASYLIGMELPGRRALFSSLSMEFPPDVPACTPFEYQAEIERISDIGELTVGAQLSSGGHIWARATINAYVRQDVPPLSVEQVEKSVGRSEAMAGKVALVTGASRGLGACIVSALALHGCTILMNFVHSRSAAEQLRDSLAHSSGQLVLEQGDVADVRWCLELQHRIAARQKRLDFLICNASPALLPLWLEPTAAARVNQFLSTSLAMIAAPTAALMPLLAHSKGWNVLISSSAVTQIHPHFPHYAAAKSAAEALTRAAIAEYRTVSGLIVRPTRLLTDLTNTPIGRKDALRPECVGGAVVNRLLGPACPGKIEVLDEFSSG